MSVQAQVNIKELLHEEIHLVDKWFAKKREVLEPIILSAARKLEPYFENKREICRALEKVCNIEAQRDIRRYCPQQYKRLYTIDAMENMPKNIIEELFMHLIDFAEDLADVGHNFIENFRELDVDQQAEFMEFTIKTFGSFAELKKRVDMCFEMSVTFARLKKITDSRQKLRALHKFLLRLQAFYMSKNQIEGIYKISSKWVKQGIEDNKQMEELATIILRSDKALSKIADWWDDQIYRISKHKPLLPVPR